MSHKACELKARRRHKTWSKHRRSSNSLQKHARVYACNYCTSSERTQQQWSGVELLMVNWVRALLLYVKSWSVITSGFGSYERTSEAQRLSMQSRNDSHLNILETFGRLNKSVWRWFPLYKRDIPRRFDKWMVSVYKKWCLVLYGQWVIYSFTIFHTL